MSILKCCAFLGSTLDSLDLHGNTTKSRDKQRRETGDASEGHVRLREASPFFKKWKWHSDTLCVLARLRVRTLCVCVHWNSACAHDNVAYCSVACLLQRSTYVPEVEVKDGAPQVSVFLFNLFYSLLQFLQQFLVAWTLVPVRCTFRACAKHCGVCIVCGVWCVVCGVWYISKKKKKGEG